MKCVTVYKKDFASGMEALKESYKTFGPVKDRDFHLFKKLEKGQAPDLSCLNTRLSPKSLVYPQSQVMFEYTLDETQTDHHILKELEEDSFPRAIFGIRPCDAKAFLLVKRNFDTSDYQDPYWVRAYEITTFVGFACENPCTTCFCTTAGCGPYHEEGLDLLMADAGDRYFIKVITQKGDELLSAAGWRDEVNAETAEKKLLEMKAAAEANITTTVDTNRLKDLETTALYEAPFWEDVAFSCINCGTCTYVCPTCWCFDIQDETQGHSGKRMRNWDSCMYPLFTLHGSGHNPRGPKTQRVRQRFMHKLKYYLDKYDSGIQCVGCGRCIQSCPVNIDIRKVCRLMNSFKGSTGTIPS
jgi:ferredoxin